MHPIVSILPMDIGKFLDSCNYKQCCGEHSSRCHLLHTHTRISLEYSFPNLAARWNHVGINKKTTYWCVAHLPRPPRPRKTFWFNWYRVWLEHLGLRKQVWSHYPSVSAWEWNCQVVGYVHLPFYTFSYEECGKIPVALGLHQYMVLSDSKNVLVTSVLPFVKGVVMWVLICYCF